MERFCPQLSTECDGAEPEHRQLHLCADLMGVAKLGSN